MILIDLFTLNESVAQIILPGQIFSNLYRFMDNKKAGISQMTEVALLGVSAVDY